MSAKLIVITGASSGIGAAAAVAFSKKGHNLLLLARRVELLENLLNDPSNTLSHENTLISACDVTNIDQIRNGIIKAQEKFNSPVDCLINNAGVMYIDALVDQPIEKQTQMYQTNVIGILNGINVVLLDMIQRQTGTIINVSSIAGRKSFPSLTAYCGTKFAVNGLSESLRAEVSGSKVRVVVVSPGSTETELLHQNSQEKQDPWDQWKSLMELTVTTCV